MADLGSTTVLPPPDLCLVSGLGRLGVGQGKGTILASLAAYAAHVIAGMPAGEREAAEALLRQRVRACLAAEALAAEGGAWP